MSCSDTAARLVFITSLQLLRTIWSPLQLHVVKVKLLNSALDVKSSPKPLGDDDGDWLLVLYDGVSQHQGKEGVEGLKGFDPEHPGRLIT